MEAGATRTPSAPRAAGRVLSTMNEDGSRRWLRPRPSQGRFLNRRRAVGWLLILLFTATPYLRIGGKPVLLLDVVHREFTLFGATFLPTDTLLLALLFVSIFLAIFWLTALFGRVWCGWGCPQTIYMELVYRPLQRLIEGRWYRSRTDAERRAMPAWRRAALGAAYLLVSMFLAHTFLAYFVGVENLAHWMTRSPLEHPAAFAVMAVTTGLMMADFCFMREQVCTLMCPYGRLQSVLLDSNSLIIGYDEARGEPRGPLRKQEEAGGAPRGDCIDCGLCVSTCPTGIDIRAGLQMECVACAQCIDACDAVMDKIGRPRGLIRYGSQGGMTTGKNRLLRPRTVIYPALLALVVTAFGWVLSHRAGAEISFLRVRNAPYRLLESGDVASSILLKITNRGDEPRVYTVRLEGEGTLVGVEEPVPVAGLSSAERGASVVLPRSAFRSGRSPVTLRVLDDAGGTYEAGHDVLGPLFEGSKP